MNAREALIHDLRAPLQLIAGCAEMLEMELGENARAGEYVRLLSESAAEMRAMLESALENGRAEAQSSAESVELVRRTREICARYRLNAARRGVRLTFSASAAAVPMRLDTGKYARILANLLSNALKYTPPGGHIAISLAAEEACVRVAVADDGCGIEPEALAALRARLAGEGEEPGKTLGHTRLGLINVHRRIQALYGEDCGVQIESTPGEGTGVTVRIRLLDKTKNYWTKQMHAR